MSHVALNITYLSTASCLQGQGVEGLAEGISS
jgi:hypothetical protein